MSLTNIAIFKNKEFVEGGNRPPYHLVSSWKDDSGNWKSVTVGSLWKGDKEGGPSLRGEMKKAWHGQDGKSFPGFVIAKAREEAPQKDFADMKQNELSTEEIDPNDVPF